MPGRISGFARTEVPTTENIPKSSTQGRDGTVGRAHGCLATIYSEVSLRWAGKTAVVLLVRRGLFVLCGAG